jgi:hypothetical protein
MLPCRGVGAAADGRRIKVNLADHLASEAAVKVGSVERLHGRRGAHERWLKNRLIVARKHSPKLERLEKLLLLDLGCAPCAQPSQRVANQQEWGVRVVLDRTLAAAAPRKKAFRSGPLPGHKPPTSSCESSHSG